MPADEPTRWEPAWIVQQADRFRYALLGVAAATFAATCTLRWRPGNDSAELLVIARQLNQTGNFRTLGGYHEGVMSGYPWLLAWLDRLGDAATLALVLHAIAFAAWVAFVFLWVRARFDRPTAVVVAAMCALSARTMEAAADVLPGMLFATLLATLFWWEATPRRAVLRWVVVALLLGAMLSLRSVSVLVAGGWLFSIGWQVWRRPSHTTVLSSRRIVQTAALATVFGGSVALVLLVPALRKDLSALFNDWGSYGWAGVASATSEAIFRSVPEAILGIDPTPYGGPVLIAAAAWGWVLLLRRDGLAAFVVFALALPWFLFLATPRYVVPALPALYLGLWLLVNAWHRRWPSGRVWIALAFSFVVVGNLVGIGRLIHEQRQPDFLNTYRDGRYVTARAAADWLADHTTRGTRVVCTTRDKAVLSHWSGRAVLDSLSTPAENAGRLLLVEPFDDAFREAMRQRGWSLSEPLAEFEPAAGRSPWTLYDVIRPGRR
ncbi:MAG: hypothetical protein AAF916_03150 [Planctomycetota bacterium]